MKCSTGASIGNALITKYDPMEESGAMETGDLSQRFLKGARTGRYAMLKGTKKIPKSLTRGELIGAEKIPIKREPSGTTGIVPTGPGKELKKSSGVSVEIHRMGSLTPFPNIDQVESPTTSLIDGSTRQLKELMDSCARSAVTEENLLKSINSVNAAANCAKNIQGLLKLKLDIYKAYKVK